MKKAIFINSETRDVSVVTMENQLKETYALIGCTCVAGAISFAHNDLLVVDDEGMFYEGRNGFIIDGQFLYGNAVVWGCDEEGESADVKISVEEIKSQIHWLTAMESEIMREKIVNSPTTMFFW